MPVAAAAEALRNVEKLSNLPASYDNRLCPSRWKTAKPASVGGDDYDDDDDDEQMKKTKTQRTAQPAEPWRPNRISVVIPNRYPH